jgi:hypothetical protein
MKKMVMVLGFMMLTVLAGCEMSDISSSSGECVASDDCNDGNDCTVDICDVAGVCQHALANNPECLPEPECTPTDEICDGADNDCDGEIDEGTECDACPGGPIMPYYRDSDSDGYGDPSVSERMCSGAGAIGWVDIAGDCNDANPDIYPDAAEVCDGADNDCDGETDEGLAVPYYVDRDGDGYGDSSFIVAYQCPGASVTGQSEVGSDCNDFDAAIHPDAGCPPCETAAYYRDGDSDGYGDISVVEYFCVGAPMAGYVANADDCNDSDSSIHPDTPELCDDVDNDCDGEVDEICS